MIEVMIAIAIVSLVLTAAYAITNRNTSAIQANQERLQAQRLVESQIEALYSATKLTAPSTCFDSAGVPGSGTSCVRSGLSNSGATYTISVTPPLVNSPAPCGKADMSGAGSYTVCAYWSGLGDTKTNGSNVTMYYRPS
jgi:type II secretory pathway pseudopilin PulG